ncbi:hypothetical protein EH165_03090 [Nakamurella antarctica]|uniref:Uncharacterized protein n=1 Tax=Nakamurella antarctica TaxID=1902245 RepID=A0A3G8ZTC4_9ACTN|nr:hypothetical protein [Nakamurella antarctica]AZI57296.1 hypothetical protein EH165_03090 [Nakamurella antarctica]
MVPDLGKWSFRLPRVFASLSTAIPILILVILETLAEICSVINPCRPGLDSVGYWVATPTVMALTVLMVLCFFAPWMAVWSSSVLCVVVAVTPGFSVYSQWWLLLTLGLVVMGLIGVDDRRRQRFHVASWGAPLESPRLPAEVVRRNIGHRRPWGITGFLIASCALLLTVHGEELDAQRLFESSFQQVSGTVVEQGADGTLIVESAGESFTIESLNESYPVGSKVLFRADPATGRAELVAEPSDPSYLMGLGLVALAAAACLAGHEALRRRRRASLLRDGGTAVQLYRRTDSATTLTFSLADSPEAKKHRFLCGEVVPIATRGAGIGAAEWQEWQPPEVDRSDPGAAPESGWPRDRRSAESEDVTSTPLGNPELVTVIGRLTDGYPILVVDGDTLFISAGVVRDPWRLRRLLPYLFEQVLNPFTWWN